MLKDFKYIIKKILIGVGIALCLMYLKGGLIANAYALSCDEDNYSYLKVLQTDVKEAVGNSTNLDIVYLTKSTINNGVRVPFNNSDYIEIKVPLSYVYAIYQNNTIIDNPNTNTFSATEYSYLTNQQPVVYLTDNTNNPNNNIWTQGWSDGSYYHFKYFKKSFNTNYVNITSLKFGVSNTPILNAQVTTWVYINNYWVISYNKCDSNQALQNAIDENTQAVNSVNDSLNDESDANTSGFLQDINQDYSNNPVSDLITMPITFLQKLNNNVSGSCITWNLGSLLGTNLTMPCINLQQILGSTLYNLIDMAICLFLAYNLGLMCVTIWNNMTSLKDDFDSMYSPNHNSKYTGGDS